MTKPTNTQQLAAYLRVSTSAQAASGIGMDVQRDSITTAAAQAGYTITAWHEDAGKSGASMRNRPGLQAALASITSGEAGGLVVAKIDRLGRSSSDVLGLVERAHREGWRLLALDVGLDTTTPAGEMVAAALAMAARFEYRRISERQLEKHQQLRREGRPRGRASTPTKTADAIIAMRHASASYRKIAGELNARKVPTAQGGKEWTAASVRSAYLTRQRELETAA